MGTIIYQILEKLNGEKGTKRILLSYAQYQALKIMVLQHLIK